MQTRNLIGGEWVGARSGATLEVRNPATDEVIAEVPDGSTEETRAAIEAAAAALPGWRARTAADRGAILRRLAELMLAQTERLARLMTLEQGKPLAEARGEIAYAASFVDWAAEEGKRLYGETIPASAPDKRILVLRQPVGVTASITPWNFPTAMITRKLGPALASGCTMVVKPAESTPLSALAIGELAVEAGVPPGVIGIVTGDAAAIGDELLGNPSVRKLSFTGSTEVGKLLMTKAATNVTRLSLELGGHAPFLVFDDADLDAAVAGAMATKFRNAGQTCICANRILVQAGVHAAFRDRLATAIAGLRVGDGLDDGVTIGPLIDDAAVEKVEAHVEDARRRGAKVVCGGTRARPGERYADRFYAPTLLDGVTPGMLVSTEETFGPVAPIGVFADEAEAVARANDCRFGLAAYFYTRDAGRLMRVAEALEYGIVGANDGAPSTAQAPFGGVKESGFGREGGHHVMHEYTDVKYVSWKL
jgi:succinate-semialdehyde dehydrogenase/glutarate-semialdehyde dehydrogenase